MNLNFSNNEKVNIENEMQQSYMDYAMSVIIGRALPDVRDGLKPVHRRVLYAMHDLGNDYNKPYKKSARVVGDVIGKYHPHGDAAVYDTIVRLAQDFAMRYPLVDGQGNFGSIDGDSPAAMRYTEVRMDKLAHELLTDIEKETVDFGLNYDETQYEPQVLPSKFPNLLINGSEGIAVGMATKIPPHNMAEITDGLVALIDNPRLPGEDLLNYVPGPDFPTGGYICGTEGIKNAYKTGHGVIQIQAKAYVEKDNRSGKEKIVVNELPYQTNKAKLIEKIAELVKDKKIEGISDLRDESDRDGMRVVIELKKDAVPEVILNTLYKMTPMQTSFGVNLLAIVGGQPKVLSLLEILNHFLDHRKEIITNRCIYDLKKAEARCHILEGLKIALENLEDVINIIKNSSSPQVAKEELIAKYSFSDNQAQAILDMRLHRLTGLERDKIVKEYEDILKKIARLKEILASDVEILNIVRNELLNLKEKFGDNRRAEIIPLSNELTLEDLIVEEDMVVTVTRSGYIKRQPVSLYRNQKRGGKGRSGLRTKEEDFVEHLFIASTHAYILIFTDIGKVHWLRVHEIPKGGRTSRGKPIVNLLQLQDKESVTSILPVKEFTEGYYVVTITKNGVIKKTDLSAYSRPRQGGIVALTVDEGDRLVSTRITDGDLDIFIASKHGKCIRFPESDVRVMGRTARGVRGMMLDEMDQIIGMEVITNLANSSLITVTTQGYGKRTKINEYRRQSRGGKGIIAIKNSERIGDVVDIRLVDDENDLMVITNKGKLLRTPVSRFSEISRNTQGVRIISLEDQEYVVAVTTLAEKEDHDSNSDNLFEENDED